MKSKQEKQRDLNALTEQLNDAKSAMVVGFNKVTVAKDQEFRNQLRDAGAKYQVVKNTIARRAVKETPYQDLEENFLGMSAIAWTNEDPVVLSKAVSKFIKDNAEIYSFKTGMVEGKVVDFTQVQSIASLPSKEELIAKVLFLLNAPAQRLATVISAVPRNLAIVIKQIGDAKPAQAEQPKAETSEAPPQEETAETTEPAAEASATPEETAQAVETEAPKEETGQTNEQSAETVETPEAAQTTEPEAEQETVQETAPAEAEEKSE